MENSDYLRIVSHHLGERMKALDLSVEVLADKVNVYEKELQRWIDGIVLPPSYYLPNLAKALDCTIDSLFAYDEKLLSELKKTATAPLGNEKLFSQDESAEIVQDENFTLKDALRGKGPLSMTVVLYRGRIPVYLRDYQRNMRLPLLSNITSITFLNGMTVAGDLRNVNTVNVYGDLLGKGSLTAANIHVEGNLFSKSKIDAGEIQVKGDYSALTTYAKKITADGGAILRTPEEKKNG
jgi:transcriptional regulator with XRE-family HTH domain